METRYEERPGLRTLLERPRNVLGAFAALSLVLTLPLAFRFTTHLPAGTGDVWQNYWNFWWWKTALFELGQHPYHSKLIFYPNGTDLIFHTHSSWNQIAAMPVNLLWGEAAAYNFCVLMALTLSGYGMWLLVRELTGDGRAGFLAGVVFTLFPQHIEQTLEHLNLFSTQFMPWALYYMVRLVRQGGVRNSVGLGVTFAFNALCSWHLGLILTLGAVPLLVYLALTARRPKRLLARDAAVACLLAGLILAPAVWPLIAKIAEGATYYRKADQDLGIDAAYLLTPSYGHPLWGWLAARRYVDRAYGAAGFLSYLGAVPLVLAGLALRRRAPGRFFWLGFTAFGLIFALGAHPWWNGRLLDVTLLAEILKSVPIFSTLRVANRFHILTSLGLGVLVGLGWTVLRRRTDARFLLVAGLIVLDYAWLPYPMRKVEISPVYQQMLDYPIMRIGGVIDIPFLQRSRAAHNIVAQTVHGRPIVAGYLSTLPTEAEDFIRNEPALADLVDVPKLSRPIDFRRLIQLGFDTMILHKYRYESYGKRVVAATPPRDILGLKLAQRLGGVPDETMDEIRRQLTEHNGPPVFEDEHVAVFYLRSGFGDEAAEPVPEWKP